MTLVPNPEGWREESAGKLGEEEEREPFWPKPAGDFTGDH